MTNDRAGSTAPAAGDDDGVATRLEELLDVPHGPVDWRTVGSRTSAAKWADLRDWVQWFRGEFGVDHRVVPPCWYRHSALVSVLSALRDHWLAAYDPLGALIGPSDWHRALLQLEGRLRDWASRTGCTAEVHRADQPVRDAVDEGAWTAHLNADVAARRERERQQSARAAGLVALPGFDGHEVGGDE